MAFTHESLGIPKEQLMTRVLPFLLPLSVDHGLNKQQVSSIDVYSLPAKDDQQEIRNGG